MAYYTLAHFLHSMLTSHSRSNLPLTLYTGSIDGSKPGLLPISHEQMTDEIWEYIFRDGPWPANSTIPKEHVDTMKREFDYFYPFDIRSSGKDLIPNHLTFCVYNHAALFPEDKWPLSMRTNGHLMLNGQKMSKSKGNTLTMRQGIEKFGAGAMRLALADAGDGIEDANFDEKSANANILRLHTLIGWCEEMMQDLSKLRTGTRNFHDRVFEHEVNELINVTYGHYNAYVSLELCPF
jgi:leucyl-tRNA synthetase